VVDATEQFAESKYTTQTDAVSIAVVSAEGHKCDRCWNYSTQVGQSKAHPLLCERCIPALDGHF
jgi:isoleucyl-tRNA synthetase